MNKRALVALSSVLTLILAGYLLGCVDVPSTGPAVPNYTGQVRWLNVDPTLAGLVISMAQGTDRTFNDITIGDPGASLAYVSYPAGGKSLFVKQPVPDPDTSSLTVNTDQRGTIFIVPRPTAKSPRFIFLSERYVFGSTGIAGNARVKFANWGLSDSSFNVLQRASTDSVQSAATGELAFGAISPWVNVPAGTTEFFYFQSNRDGATHGDSVSITGASNQDYTVVAYDSIAVLKVKAFSNN